MKYSVRLYSEWNYNVFLFPGSRCGYELPRGNIQTCWREG